MTNCQINATYAYLSRINVCVCYSLQWPLNNYDKFEMQVEEN